MTSSIPKQQCSICEAPYLNGKQQCNCNAGPLQAPTSNLSTPVYKHLNGVESWDNASQDARIVFYGEMKGKSYGIEPTRNAWDWFLNGWNGRSAPETPTDSAEALSHDLHKTQVELDESARNLRTIETRAAAIIAWLKRNQPDVWTRGLWEAIRDATGESPLETNEHCVKGLASAGSSAAVNPHDIVGGSAEPSGRPAGNVNTDECAFPGCTDEGTVCPRHSSPDQPQKARGDGLQEVQDYYDSLTPNGSADAVKP